MMERSARVDELLEAALDAYEALMRRFSDLQRTLGRALGFEPARAVLELTADCTRDIAAVQLSGARWLLDA